MKSATLTLAALLVVSGILCNGVVNGEFANQWAVYMHGGMQAATQVALEHGFRNMGSVSFLISIQVICTVR